MEFEIYERDCDGTHLHIVRSTFSLDGQRFATQIAINHEPSAHEALMTVNAQLQEIKHMLRETGFDYILWKDPEKEKPPKEEMVLLRMKSFVQTGYISDSGKWCNHDGWYLGDHWGLELPNAWAHLPKGGGKRG